MAQFSLEGDKTGLPKTTRSKIPYEIRAVGPGAPRESWGAGNGSTSIVCRVLWQDSWQWIRDMVGEVTVVKPGATPTLKRYIPEQVQFSDERLQWCTMVEQVSQGGNPGDDTSANFSEAGSNWPQVAWVEYRATFEAPPYEILTDAEVAAVQTAAGSYSGAVELYQYVIRSRRTYSKEQPIPAASTAGGFKVAAAFVPGKAIGQIGFRVIELADVTYKLVRVPVNFPPPKGYTGGTPTNPWPPASNPVALDTTKEYARDAFIGTINDTWFDAGAPNGYAFAPGTLLYTGYDDSNRYYDAAGDLVCDITYNFRWKGGRDAGGLQGGWNFFLDASGNWKYVTLNGLLTGTPPYTSNDFNALFRFST